MNGASPLEGRIRVRVCGLLVDGDAVLMVRMNSPTWHEPIWMPPGGGLEFGETLAEGLVREMLEETGLLVEPGHLMYTTEFLRAPFHTVEYYWKCRPVSGELALGMDPEFAADRQILQKVEFLPLASLASLPVFPEYLRTNLAADLAGEPCIRHFIQRP